MASKWVFEMILTSIQQLSWSNLAFIPLFFWFPRPSMRSESGHLVFATAKDKDIRFQTSEAGRVKVNNEDLIQLLGQARFRFVHLWNAFAALGDQLEFKSTDEKKYLNNFTHTLYSRRHILYIHVQSLLKGSTVPEVFFPKLSDFRLKPTKKILIKLKLTMVPTQPTNSTSWIPG